MAELIELDDGENPLAVLSRCRDNVRRLCGDIESLADQLGGRQLSPAICRTVLSRLRNDLPLCHRNEELLFRLLVSRSTGPSSLKRCVEVAISEHSRAETCTIELAEPLTDAREGLLDWNPDALGYLMRHCFETIARHLEWEEAAIFGEIDHRMSPLEIRMLREGFRRNFRMLNQDIA